MRVMLLSGNCLKNVLQSTGAGCDPHQRHKRLRIHALVSLNGMTPEAVQQSQENLVRFLRIDLSLSRTFLQTARLASEPEHYEALLEKVRYAIETIRALMGRVQDRVAWAAIHAETDAVEAELQSLPPWDWKLSKESN